MKRVETLREQARVLRTLAASFDVPQIKEDLLELAERCDQLAVGIGHYIAERMAQPISGGPPAT